MYPDHGCRRPSDCVVCNRDSSKITARELALRERIERRHDAKAGVAREIDLDAERQAREGLCPCCGELIGDVPRCPICKSVLWRGDPCKSANTK